MTGLAEKLLRDAIDMAKGDRQYGLLETLVMLRAELERVGTLMDKAGLQTKARDAIPTRVGNCCPHQVERHAYNGCADCGCAVQWSEHPDRDLDTSGAALLERIAIARRTEQAADDRDDVEQSRAATPAWVESLLRLTHAELVEAISNSPIIATTLLRALRFERKVPR